MDDVTAGVSGSMERLVEEKYCTRRGNWEIFSTPNLVLLVEETAISTLAPYLREGQACVGSSIDIVHSAPTLRGQRVTATTTVSNVDRRRVVFDVEVQDDVETISKGRHERFIVDVDKLAARLAAKVKTLG